MAANHIQWFGDSLRDWSNNRIQNYHHDLLAKHSDQRQYARGEQKQPHVSASQEQPQVLASQPATEVQSKEQLLETAYTRQVQQNREDHMAKRRVDTTGKVSQEDTRQ